MLYLSNHWVGFDEIYFINSVILQEIIHGFHFYS